MSKSIIAQVFVLAVVLLLGYSLWAFSLTKIRNEKAALLCQNNLRMVVLGMHKYESAYGTLPLARGSDEEGKPFCSWRTYLYPSYLAPSIPKFYDSSESWDSSKNARLIDGTTFKHSTPQQMIPHPITLDPIPDCLCCPTIAKNNRLGVNYVVVVGELTAFPKDRAVTFDEITDGLENTIVLVESKTCNPKWTEPADLDFDSMSFEINCKDGEGISSHHTGGAYVCFADGVVSFFDDEGHQRRASRVANYLWRRKCNARSS